LLPLLFCLLYSLRIATLDELALSIKLFLFDFIFATPRWALVAICTRSGVSSPRTFGAALLTPGEILA
jgi:hypothetical protein